MKRCFCFPDVVFQGHEVGMSSSEIAMSLAFGQSVVRLYLPWRGCGRMLQRVFCLSITSEEHSCWFTSYAERIRSDTVR